MVKRNRISSFRPLLEVLEPRQMLAITATLSNGVLSIVGTDDADTATINRTKAGISVAETGQTFAIRQVQAIDVALLDGDDILEINHYNKKNKQVSGWINVALTAEAGGGDDQFINTNVRILYYGGTSSTLSVKKGGTELINGEKPTWFDYSLIASDVRSTAKQEFYGNRKVLDRGGMLNVFDTVATAGNVSQHEFISLSTLVSNRELYKGVQYVQVLASYIAQGTIANAYYQGETLGNLEVGSTKEHLQTLVGKWYLGTDLPGVTLIGPENAKYFPEYREVAGQLYVNGVHFQDTNDPQFDSVNQGALGDCYYLAALSAMTKQTSKPVKDMFIDNGDGTFTVRFFDNGQRGQVYFVTVNKSLPTDADGKLVYAGQGKLFNDPNNELWVALAEKAYAQVAEFGWIKAGRSGHEGTNSYYAIEYGFAGNVIADVLGQPTKVNQQIRKDTFYQAIANFQAGMPVAYTSIQEAEKVDPRVPGNHVYAMIGFDARTQQVQLYNPWGVDSGEAKAKFWITWQDLVPVIRSWCFGPQIT